MLEWTVRDPEIKRDIKESVAEIINAIKEMNAQMRYITEIINKSNERV